MKKNIKDVLIISIIFILTLYLYSFISFVSFKDMISDGRFKSYLSSNLWHVEVILVGLLLGMTYFLIDQWANNSFLRTKSFGINIFIRSVLYFTSVIVVSIAIYLIFQWMDLIPPDEMKEFRRMASSRIAIGFMVYYGIIVLLINFFQYVNRMLGPGVMKDLILGKYYHSREENLVFLFLDLQRSTTLNEKMGHRQYSKLLKDCIHDLTPFIHKYKTRIYQYVGDEVVLFWSPQDAEKYSSYALPFDYNHYLQNRGDYYQKNYGHLPFFKGGMDTGVVTVTEIGDVKREFAYHGDVLNTASRLEGLCNQYGQQLIITEQVKDLFNDHLDFSADYLNDLPLKGKKEKVRYYGIKERI